VSTSLLGGTRLTPDDAREVHFPSQILGGYQIAAVEAFRARVAAELGQLLAALAERATREAELSGQVADLRDKNSRLRTAQSASGPQPLPDEQQAVAILRAAQGQADNLVTGARQEADRTVSGARHQADQVMTHATQQAGSIVEQARAEGLAEKARIIAAATDEARRQVDRLLKLAGVIQGELRGNVDRLLLQLGEWEQQASDGAQLALIPE
jgi:DivIVA domain-containing protein